MWQSHFHSPRFVSWLYNRKAVFLFHEWYKSVGTAGLSRKYDILLFGTHIYERDKKAMTNSYWYFTGRIFVLNGSSVSSSQESLSQNCSLVVLSAKTISTLEHNSSAISQTIFLIPFILLEIPRIPVVAHWSWLCSIWSLHCDAIHLMKCFVLTNCNNKGRKYNSLVD